MASVNLEKPSNILRSKKGYGLNISQSITYVKEYCYVFSIPWKILYNNRWISQNLTIICLKRISEKCFLFNVNVNTSLKFLLSTRRVAGGQSGTCALRGHLDTRRKLGHLGTRRALYLFTIYFSLFNVDTFLVLHY